MQPAGRRIFEENLQRSLSAEELELRLRKWKGERVVWVWAACAVATPEGLHEGLEFSVTAITKGIE